MENRDKCLSPFVYWGQNNETISLKIDLKNVKSPAIDLKENSLQFNGSGIGAKGLNEYSFLIHFYSEVDPKESFYKVNDRDIQFVIRKKTNVLWSRLLSSGVRPQWLKVDFDRIHNEDESDDNHMDKQLEELIPNQQNSYRNFGQKDFGRRRKSMRKGFKVEDFKKTYLFLYNLFQFVGFVYVFIILGIRYIKDGLESTESAYLLVGKVMKFLHLMQILEILHPLMGYTAGSALMPSIQLFGRCFLIFVMIDSEPKIQTNCWVFYLFFIYTSVEIIRYPYYMFRVFDVNINLLTWIRYTAWIVLYPLGFIAEGVILFKNITNLEESGKYSIELPNPLNFSFNLPTIIRVYLLIGFFPLMYLMMGHMYRQRNKVLSSKAFKKKIH